MYHYNSANDIGNLKNIRMNSNIELVKGDIRDYNLLKSLASDADCIINMAALIGIPYSYDASESYFDTNSRGTLNILNIAKEIKNEQVVIISTSEMFGNPSYTPIDEKHPLNPQSPYAASKSAAEQFSVSYIHSFNLPATILRPFNTFGPGQSLRAVIPAIISQSLRGNTINIGSTDTFRDFNYIDNTIDGIISAILNPNALKNTFNIGYGKAYSIIDVILAVSTILGKQLIISKDKSRIRPKNSEIKMLLCNYEKANRVLGYKPAISFEKGLKKTIKWYSSKKIGSLSSNYEI